MPEFSVTTTCRTCGSVPIEPERIQLHLQEEPVSYFSCSCPLCGQILGGTVGTQVALGLAGRGASIAEFPFSQELLERPCAAPPLSADDVIEFHYLLDNDDWFEELQSSFDSRGV